MSAGDRRGPRVIEPLDVDGVRAVAIGTAVWAVALLALLPFHDRLVADGRGTWVWTCLAGVLLGLLGLVYCRRRRDRLAALRAPRGQRPTSSR